MGWWEQSLGVPICSRCAEGNPHPSITPIKFLHQRIFPRLSQLPHSSTEDDASTLSRFNFSADKPFFPSFKGGITQWKVVYS